MKKSQRLRLAALLAKDSTKFTAAEKSELSTLQALAATHADASKDVDDARKISVAEFFSRLTGASAALAQAAADLVAEKAKVADLTSQLEAAKAAAVPAVSDADKAAALEAKAATETKISALTGLISAAAAALGLKSEEVAALSPETIQAKINSRIDAAATDKLASLGFPVSGLPPIAGADANLADDKVMTHEAFSKLSPTEKKKFSLRGGRITAMKFSGVMADLLARN